MDATVSGANPCRGATLPTALISLPSCWLHARGLPLTPLLSGDKRPRLWGWKGNKTEGTRVAGPHRGTWPWATPLRAAGVRDTEAASLDTLVTCGNSPPHLSQTRDKWESPEELCSLLGAGRQGADPCWAGACNRRALRMTHSVSKTL